MDTPLPTAGDFYVKAPRQYEVVAVRPHSVTLRGEYGTLFSEPYEKLAAVGYQLVRQPILD